MYVLWCQLAASFTIPKQFFVFCLKYIAREAYICVCLWNVDAEKIRDVLHSAIKGVFAVAN